MRSCGRRAVGDLLARDPDLALSFADVPDVVRPLVQRFVGDTSDAHQRAALDVCAVVRAVDEPTLGALIPGADAAAEAKRNKAVGLGTRRSAPRKK